MTNPAGQPSFPEGTVIVVDPDREATTGSLVIVRFEGEDEATFKRLERHGREQVLVPLNPQFSTIPITEGAEVRGVEATKVLDARRAWLCYTLP